MRRLSGWNGAALLFALAASACAPKRLDLPTGDTRPFPDAAAAYEAAIRACRGANTLQVTLHLSGKAGGTGLRGSVDAGFQAPDALRLEGRHPLGRPVFILVAAGSRATLLMPREDRVLRDVAPSSIVEALVGLSLSPAELRALAAGCGFGAGMPENGREFPGGVVAVDVAGTTAFLRQQQGAWRLIAAARPPMQVFYTEYDGTYPRAMRLQTSSPARTDLTVRLEDVNVNVPMEQGVFEVAVPSSAQPVTIDELRRAGPLGDR